ncbi:MAG: Subtilisin-like serine protease [Chthonomonadaceae bacterium]|nr:Subtilisin-like serine protease [Chthonomonadaceae bacterium]
MIHKPRLRHLGRALAFAALFATGAAHGAFGQVVGNPQTKPGEIILYMQPGTAVADVNALAATVNSASVTPLLLKDCYVLELPAVRATAQDTATAVATLKMNPNVRWVNASRIYKPTQASAAPKITPNDPMFAQQWYLPLINAPQAWVLSKGVANVNLCWIDTGFATQHEDLIGQYLPDSYNFADNNTNIDAGGSVLNATEDGHGIATSSIAFGLTNNSKGIAGIDWGGTKCLALKAKTDGVAFFSSAALLNSYAYILTNKDKDHIVAVNMSYGADGGDPTGGGGSDPEFVATKALADAGVLMVASAGNSSDFTGTPAAFPHVIAVSAVDRNSKLTAYSSFGKVEMSAPGGDNADTGVTADGMAEADFNNTYVFESGTSNSAPVITSVFGLMMAIPGVTTAQAKQAMFDTANRTGLGITSLPDPKYGYGIVDAYAALLRVSVSVIIDDPIGINASGISTDPSGLPPPPTETLKPVLRFKVSNVPLANLSIKIDAGTAQEVDLTTAFLQNQIESGNTTGTNPQYVVAFRYTFPNTAPFNHTITITGTNPNTSTTATDVRTFTIQSHTIPSGISFVSIPYYESAADSPTTKVRDVTDLLAPNVTLYRWLNLPTTTTTTAGGTTVVQGNYAAFGNGQTDINASLHPTSFVPTPDTTGVQSDVTPLGVGYFINAPGPVTVVTYGTSYDTTSFRIPLHEGWNMVGNPYKFSIPFDGLVFEQTNGNRVTAEAAADLKLILPFIYRYVAGQYQFQTLPAGNLNAWEGQWIYVVPKNANSLRQDTVLTMITTPVAVSGATGRAASKAVTRGTTRAASLLTPTTPKVSGAGSWTVQLQASSKDLRDSYNFIGVTNPATKSANSLVPKPPHPSPYVTLGITDPAGNGTVYAQSLQTAGGVKTWNVVVNTDQPNTDITVRWPNVSTLPKTYRLTMQDTATGQVVDLRNQASYQFNSGHNAGTRAFVLTAHPTNSGGRAVLTNINVNPPRIVDGRAAGAYQIGYTVSQDAQVEVAVVGYNGQIVAVVGSTRAVSSGDNSQVWNGKDTKGAGVPAGTYLLQVKAITSDGTVTREIRPLTVGR